MHYSKTSKVEKLRIWNTWRLRSVISGISYGELDGSETIWGVKFTIWGVKFV